MKRVARDICKLARDLVFDADIKLVRGDVEDYKLRKVFSEVHSFLDKVRKNEDIEIYTACRGGDNEMEISIGLTDHEAKEAILRDAIKKIEKYGKRMGIEVIAKER